MCRFDTPSWKYTETTIERRESYDRFIKDTSYTRPSV